MVFTAQRPPCFVGMPSCSSFRMMAFLAHAGEVIGVDDADDFGFLWVGVTSFPVTVIVSVYHQDAA